MMPSFITARIVAVLPSATRYASPDELDRGVIGDRVAAREPFVGRFADGIVDDDDFIVATAGEQRERERNQESASEQP